MKHLLEKSVQSLIAGNTDDARLAFKEYVTAKSRAIFEKVEKDQDMVSGQCDDCGEDATTSRAIKNSGKWKCPNCGGKKLEVGEPKKD